MLEAILNEEQMGIFGFGKKREDVGMSRREFLKKAGIGAAGLYVAGKTLGLGQEAHARAKSFPVIPEAAYKIWEKYPSMQYVLDLLNMEEYENANYVPLIEFIMFPNKVGYGKKLFTMNNVEKIKGAEFNTPQYWLLLRIADPRGLYDSLFGEKYNTIPQPPKNSGVWHFAKGLLKKNPNREQDLLKALYIGATGSEDGTIPIIVPETDSRSYMNMPEVKTKVKEWKDKYNYAPYSDEKNHFSAYLTVSLGKNFNDSNLLSLSLAMLMLNSRDQQYIDIYGDTLIDCIKLGAPNFGFLKNKKIVLPIKVF